MVSLRCKMAVKEELDKLKLKHTSIELGEVNLKKDITGDDREYLRKGLLKKGLELIDDKKSQLIEKTKTIIIELIHYSEENPKINYSDYISEKLDYNYNHLSSLFSEVTGTTIVNYIIINKIERVKELLLYDELTLTEISLLMEYSSVAHLSHQFKKITGLTPTYFKKMKQYKKTNHVGGIIIFIQIFIQNTFKKRKFM
jgi:AraC-like DNA-binding protein